MFRMGQEEKDAVARVIDSKQLFKVNGGPLQECANFEKESQKAELIQNLIGTVGFTEIGMPYPLTAKHSMCLDGIETENYARNRESAEMTDYMKDSTKQMYDLCRHFIDNVL